MSQRDSRHSGSAHHPGEGTKSITPFLQCAKFPPLSTLSRTSHLSDLCPGSERDASREVRDSGSVRA